jgi:hypothetical protein
MSKSRFVGVALVLLALAAALMVRRTFFVGPGKPKITATPLPASAPESAAPESSPANNRARPLYLADVSVSADGAAAAGVIEGRVLATGSGKPIARAGLSFFRGVGYDVTSDGEGRFRFAPPAPGTYELLTVTANGYQPFASEPGHSGTSFNARAGVKLDGVVIYLTPRRLFTVVVKEPGGKPAASAEVRAFADERGRDGAASATTDGKGEAQLAADDFDTVEARKAGFKSVRMPVDFAAQATGRMVLTLGAGSDVALKTISGRVLDDKGQPVDEALIEARSRHHESPGGRAVSDGEGHFVLRALDDGVYTLRARANGRGSVEKSDVPAGASDVELRLASRGGIRGTVSDGHGKVIPGFTVVAWPKLGSVARGEPVSSTTFAGDGRYEMLLPPGEYVVRAAAHGFAPSAEQNASVGGDVVTLDFALGRGGRIFGRVIDRQSHAAIANARVLLEGVGAGGGILLESDTLSDGSGNFSIGGVAAGRQSIEVSADGHNGRIVSGLDTSGDGEVGPLSIDLRPLADGEEPKIELVGIGIVIGADETGILVKGTAPGGGAAQAGLVPGDIILAVDGTPVEQLGFPGAVQMLRGPEDSTVTVTVRHADGSSTVIVVPRKRLTG